MLIALCSAKGAPGVTTSTLALWASWPRPALVAECDPAGGDISSGYLAGRTLAGGLGLVDLAAGQQVDESAVWRQCLEVTPHQRWILPGLSDPGQAAAVQPLWPDLADTLADVPVDVLADCGRLANAQYAAGPVVEAADMVVVVARSSLPSANAARLLVRRLGERVSADRLRLLVVGEGEPYDTGEIAGYVGAATVGSLADDPTGASDFSEGRQSGRTRTKLLRSARRVAARLAADGDVRAQHVGEPPQGVSALLSRWPPAQPLAHPGPPAAGAPGQDRHLGGDRW